LCNQIDLRYFKVNHNAEALSRIFRNKIPPKAIEKEEEEEEEEEDLSKEFSIDISKRYL
jgi:hypothetical protein